MTSYRASLFTTTTTWAAFSWQTLKKAYEKMLTSVIASNTKWVNYYCYPGNFRKQINFRIVRKLLNLWKSIAYYKIFHD